MWKKQTVVSHSPTESEIVSLDAGLLMEWVSCCRYLGHGDWSSTFNQQQYPTPIYKHTGNWCCSFQNQEKTEGWSVLREQGKLIKDRYDVLSIPNCAMKKGPSHGARHGPTERWIICSTAHNALRKATRTNYKSLLDRFRRCQLYRDSQTKKGWDENTCIAHDVIANEDHSYVKRKLVEARVEL